MTDEVQEETMRGSGPAAAPEGQHTYCMRVVKQVMTAFLIRKR